MLKGVQLAESQSFQQIAKSKNVNCVLTKLMFFQRNIFNSKGTKEENIQHAAYMIYFSHFVLLKLHFIDGLHYLRNEG
jgi:hypothetical protein